MLRLQVYALSVIMLAGMCAGLLYDALRVARTYLRRRSWLHGILDMAFWFIAAAVLAGGAMLANWGDLRFYLPLGVLAGAGLYAYLASPVAVRLLTLAGRLMHWVLLVLTWPLRRLAEAVARRVRAVWRRASQPPAPPPE